LAIGAPGGLPPIVAVVVPAVLPPFSATITRVNHLGNIQEKKTRRKPQSLNTSHANKRSQSLS